MVICERVKERDCNSCDVHLNLSRVSKILPYISTDDSLAFFVQLCDQLREQDKHNIWSILSTSGNRYQTQAGDQAPDFLAPHKLLVVLQWYEAQAITQPQRLTFTLKSLSYIGGKALGLLRDYLQRYSDYVNEEEFKPDIVHCPWSGQWPCFSEKSGCVDFISKLPVTVSKLVLSYVGVTKIWGARLVSKRWYTLIKELLTEHKAHQAHVFRCRALRPALRNVNPTYANKVALCFTTGICTTGHPYVSEESGSVKVILEERNVYCGAYHVHNLYRYSDPHRKLHYCRGKYFALGSKDRRIHVRSLDTGKLHKTIVGHAGSIQSLLLIEDKKIAISGSYDLTIRAWSIETGAYLRLWRGHRGTITCLDHNETLLISGARDSMVKVWYLNKAMIKRTFHHPRPILCVRLLGDRAAVGTESSDLYLWDLNNGTKLKVFGTVGKVYCSSLTPHFILAGAHNVLYVWNMLSLDTAPMFTFPHPSAVLSVQYCYVRCVTGCQDGKIRIWSLVSGECIKVIRGNAKGDPITAVFVDNNRLLINTTSTVIALDFQPVTWDYCSERFNEERVQAENQASKRTTKRRCKSAVQLRNYVRSTAGIETENSDGFWAVRRHDDAAKTVTMSGDVTSRGVVMTSRGVVMTSRVTMSGDVEVTELSGELEESGEVEEPDTPDVPPSSPRDHTSILESATKQHLFKDSFNREHIPYYKPAFRSGTVVQGTMVGEQLKKMRSGRPHSAPFVSASLSVHGHLPSFSRRRPKTASLVQHKVDVVPVARWQSTWQRLLSDIPEDRSPQQSKPSSAPYAAQSSALYAAQSSALYAAQSSAPCTDRRTLQKRSGAVSRPKTATARIRY